MLRISSATLDDYLALAKEDYYLNGGKPPGTWHGEGAKKLGLAEKVEARAISNLIAGMTPDGTRSLVQQRTFADDRARQIRESVNKHLRK